MPRLIVISDSLSREIETLELHEGETLAAALMRLFPEGLAGRWGLYSREVCESYRIEPVEMEDWHVKAGDSFTLVRMPGADPIFWANLGMTLLLSAVVKLFTPRPRRNTSTQSETRESGTTQIAGQSNVLRPGARVPEILGRLRVYPDLLSNAIERWTWPNSQNIRQFFVVGAGDYELANAKLGDTPLAQIASTSSVRYRPGDPVDVVACRTAPTIDNLSLDATMSGGTVPASNIQFVGATKQLISPERLSLIAGVPINVTGTLNNGTAPPGKDFFVEGVPSDSQTTGPYVYQLDGPVVDEPNAQPIITRYQPFGGASQYTDAGGDYLTAYTQIYFGPPQAGNPSPGVLNFLCMAQFGLPGGTVYRGRITDVYYRYDEPTTNVLATDMHVPNSLYGVMNISPGWSFELTNLQMWHIPAEEGAAVAAPMAAVDPIYTGWYVAPLPDADELWIDVAFPQGLVHYKNGTAFNYTVTVTAEFRRVGTTTVVVRDLGPFTAMRATYLRHTNAFPVSGLGLPGAGAVEVRLKRTSAIPANSATDQYQSDARWASLRAIKYMPTRIYPQVTIVQLGLNNTRAAASIGESAFNVVATRILPTWGGSGWNEPAVPTAKWADNFIARCKARDGANLPDAQVDIAGIYALQSQLDALDGGQQGLIALALDQEQDVDAELAQVADVVRAVVYRVGRKVFVARDVKTAARIALFNGRTKSSDAESVGVRFKSDDDHDAVTVPWVDEGSGWKYREYQYPEGLKSNVLRLSAQCANWAQAWRRAVFEWNKLRYRREQITVPVTEDGRICRPGDVVNITDDLANLAIVAGEVIYVDGLVLTLDKEASFALPGGYTLLVRDVNGQAVDFIPVTAVAGTSNKVQLGRAAVVTLKGRDEALGTLYALYANSNATVRPWLLTAVEASGAYVQLTGSNYTDRVYDGDTAALPPVPPVVAAAQIEAPALPARSVSSS